MVSQVPDTALLGRTERRHSVLNPRPTVDSSSVHHQDLQCPDFPTSQILFRGLAAFCAIIVTGTMGKYGNGHHMDKRA